MWGVYGEGLVVLVPSCGCFKSSDIRTMAKLSLSIAPDDLVVVGFGKPLFLLLRRTLAFKCNLHSE